MFSSTQIPPDPRYTKALDHIKVLRKERAQDLKVQKERLNGLKKDKEKSERVGGTFRRALTPAAPERARRDDCGGERKAD